MAWLRRQRDPVREEFDTEVLPHLDTLFANALRLTRSRTNAEDLVQETVLRAFRFFDRFERGSNVKAWLLRIQYNAFVNRYRRSTKERDIKEAMIDGPTGEDVVSRETLRALTDPTGTALRPLVLAEIEAALNELPEDHRMVVVLADLEELSYKEIAEVIGCPIGTVMSRLHRARRTLRDRLMEHASHEFKVSPVAAAAKPEEEVIAEDAPVSLSAFRSRRQA